MFEDFDDPRRFIAYLKALPEGAIVGYRASASGCPLARFAGELGIPRPRVRTHTIEWTEGANATQWDALRLWQTLFTEKFDDEPGPVTRERALAIMEGIA